MDQSFKTLNLPSDKLLNAHRWTIEEQVFKRKEQILDEIETLNIPLRRALLYKIGKSMFGPFLQELNSKQSQDLMFNENKLQILRWQLQRNNSHDTNIVQQRNGFLRNYYELLKKAVNDCEAIDMGFLRGNLKSLYLDCCFVKEMDNSLQKFAQLQILTLCGNFIKDVPGILLPRTLVFLELFDNFIRDLGTLLNHAPKSLRHLGLGRNRLKEGCKLYLFAKVDHFGCLKSLDLSDNDLHDLNTCLKSLQNCTRLTVLSLQGNPCSMVPYYKTCTLQWLPHLQTLDGTKILSKDREGLLDSDPENSSSAQLTFQCFRIMGLPEPPKDKENLQTIHLEVNLSLLLECMATESDTMDQQISPEENKLVQTEENCVKTAKNRKSKDKVKQNKINTVKGSSKVKKHSYYSGENEYNEKMEYQNFWLKTEPLPWAKILEFPAIRIGNLQYKPMGIRDTFRSTVPVRIVYLKVAPYKDTNKKRNLKSKNTKQAKKTVQSQVEYPNGTEPGAEVSVEQPKEIILKKVTIGIFYCELKSLNWSDETEDFYWADHPDVGEKAIPVKGSLKALDYDLNDSTNKPMKSPPGKPESKLGESGKQYPPNVLTCQVGFGLNRI